MFSRLDVLVISVHLVSFSEKVVKIDEKVKTDRPLALLVLLSIFGLFFYFSFSKSDHLRVV